MNGYNALDGFLARAVPVERVDPLGLTESQALIGASGAAVLCGLLTVITPSPESIERGWVIAVGADFASTLAGLLRSYGFAAAGLSVLSVLAMLGLADAPGDGQQALSLTALIAWLGSTTSLLVVTALFVAVVLLNIAGWIALAITALIVLGWLAGN